MKKTRLLIFVAWLLHLSAWLLPSVKETTYAGQIIGWKAFRLAACGVWPCKGLEFDPWHYAVLATVSTLTTLLFILGSPWVVLRGSRLLRKTSAWVAFTAFIFNTHWIVIFGPERSNLAIGYYFWWSSFLVLAAGLFYLSKQNGAEPTETIHTVAAPTCRTS
jgi:hypothetical protein